MKRVNRDVGFPSISKFSSSNSSLLIVKIFFVIINCGIAISSRLAGLCTAYNIIMSAGALVLEDGSRFEGVVRGAIRNVSGEVGERNFYESLSILKRMSKIRSDNNTNMCSLPNGCGRIPGSRDRSILPWPDIGTDVPADR